MHPMTFVVLKIRHTTRPHPLLMENRDLFCNIIIVKDRMPRFLRSDTLNLLFRKIGSRVASTRFDTNYCSQKLRLSTCSLSSRDLVDLRAVQSCDIISVLAIHPIDLAMDKISEPPTDINPYDVLELQTNATSNDIKTAYRKLALRYHPGMIR